jgi:hypothetical protein
MSISIAKQIKRSYEAGKTGYLVSDETKTVVSKGVTYYIYTDGSVLIDFSMAIPARAGSKWKVNAYTAREWMFRHPEWPAKVTEAVKAVRSPARLF